MRRRLPSFAAIRAFEAAAREGSFKAAADELCVSPSAISHQVKALEEFLDTALFDRHPGRVALTFTGRAYLGRLSQLLDQLEEATEAMRSAPPVLRVLSTPNFAARWLVPRMDRFAWGHAIRLRISRGAPDTDFARNDADVVIHWTDTPIAGALVEPFMASRRFPVATPGYIREAGIAGPEDLHRATLLRDETMDAWEDWFTLQGLPPPDASGPRYPNCELTTTAAERGQGVALAYAAMIEDTLAEGGLVRLFEAETMPIVIYSLATQRDRSDEPVIAAFRRWVMEEAAQHRPSTTGAPATERRAG